MVINANHGTLEDGDGVLDRVKAFLLVCGAQNAVTGHLSESGTKKVHSECGCNWQAEIRGAFSVTRTAYK
jgi:hypothetical protein